jgi:hypothetical protein
MAANRPAYGPPAAGQCLSPAPEFLPRQATHEEKDEAARPAAAAPSSSQSEGSPSRGTCALDGPAFVDPVPNSQPACSTSVPVRSAGGRRVSGCRPSLVTHAARPRGGFSTHPGGEKGVRNLSLTASDSSWTWSRTPRGLGAAAGFSRPSPVNATHRERPRSRLVQRRQKNGSVEGSAHPHLRMPALAGRRKPTTSQTQETGDQKLEGMGGRGVVRCGGGEGP